MAKTITQSRMSEQHAWFSRKQAAAHLRSLGYPVAARTLASMANKGKGPPYTLFMHRIASYDRAELEAWAQANSKRKGTPAKPRPVAGALQAAVTR